MATTQVFTVSQADTSSEVCVESLDSVCDVLTGCVCCVCCVCNKCLCVLQTYAVQSHYGIPHSEVRLLHDEQHGRLFRLFLSAHLMELLSPLCQLAKLHQFSMQQQGLAPISQSAAQVLPGTHTHKHTCVDVNHVFHLCNCNTKELLLSINQSISNQSLPLS